MVHPNVLLNGFIKIACKIELHPILIVPLPLTSCLSEAITYLIGHIRSLCERWYDKSLIVSLKQQAVISGLLSNASFHSSLLLIIEPYVRYS